MKFIVRDLCAWYDQLQVLWGVDIDIAESEVVGVLGRNGAGKTTLLRSLARLHGKTTGSVSLDGRDIAKLRPDVVARAGMAFVRDGGRMPSSLTVLQMLELGQRLARQRQMEPRTLAEVWNWFPILEPLRDRRAGLLSGGQRQALALASAFASRPSLLLLDEPSAGLSPVVAHELFGTIRSLVADGLSALVVEQQAAWLEGLVQRAYVLQSGKIAAGGSLETLTSEDAPLLDMQ